MPDLRAFVVTKDGNPAGFLGEGRGPFIFASDAAVPFPVLGHARFTCVDAFFEDEVGEAVEGHATFDEVAEALREGGYTLEPVSYRRVFQPPEEVPLAAPPYLAELEALLSEIG